MAKTIAISGKGGTGKTTLTSLLIRSLCAHARGAVLAVDADANACLGLTLGLTPAETVADLREEALEQKGAASGSMGRMEALEYGVHQLITEAEGFDLLTMGRPEGPKCYCAANHRLRKILDDLSRSYSFVVIDNEAGMEHLSRRTTNNVDLLLVVGEATAVGKVTVRRIVELVGTLPIEVNEVGVIWNRTDQPVSLDGLNVLGSVPNDQAIIDAAIEGKTVFDLAADSPALLAVEEILRRKSIITK